MDRTKVPEGTEISSTNTGAALAPGTVDTLSPTRMVTIESHWKLVGVGTGDVLKEIEADDVGLAERLDDTDWLEVRVAV
jgi:hypothetical protein